MNVHETTPLHIWDGVDHLGVGTVRFSDTGPSGLIESVRVSASDGEAAYTVLPGLIDTHVHLIGNASDTPADFLSWPLTTRPEEQVLHGLSHARRALAVGVTTVRDLAADDVQFSLARALEAGVVEGPRVLAYGLVNMTGGHGDLFIPPAVVERKPVADGPDACRALVRRWARSGADGIKVPVSGGVLSVGDKASWRNYTDAEIAAIVDEAHALGMRVAAHAHTEDGIRRALAHGVDSVEHATKLTDALAAQMVAAGTTVAPTLLINDRIADGSVTVAPGQREIAQELVSGRDPVFRAAAAAGVEFVLGTDANGFHVGFDDQWEELQAMARVFGWDAPRTLRAATSRAAAAIGREHDLGRIAAGFAADLVVVRGRPWQDPASLRADAVVAVVARGRVVAGALPG
ncbi:Imidazolonepropionase [Microbacterium hydrothermale]|uniref:metal-dependent hydrolase family protein n=1 Tax=Microbacterium hydrothermale TaxID=857427 RepID=UPI002225EB7B|nr:amidohydrolase family protein [Microbacterium hydrothermale]MCW2164913.1 Imidazolonepropionase [Microbacterium hydrothermale]